MTTEGNFVAILAVLTWPIVAFFLFRTRAPSYAVIWTILGALLFLPDGGLIKVQMIPALDKTSVPNLCALIACVALVKSQRYGINRFGVTEILAAILIFSPLVTSYYNGDTIVVGSLELPGVGIYDGISAAMSQTVLLLAFFVGRRFLAGASASEQILQCLALAGAIYSLPMLFEVRMSPQLSEWIYGYRSTLFFASEVRYGGYRPVVFMKNGLATAFFAATAFLASIACLRLNATISRLPTKGLMYYLGGIALLCKSAGALVYSAFGGLLVRWASPKVMIRVSMVLAIIGLSYPALRILDAFPTNALVEIAGEFSQDRAASLKFRFDQEEELLHHTLARMYFGWGRYGRNRVYSEEYSKDTSITDGLWIQTIGQFGLVGLFALFGLLTLPIFRAVKAFSCIDSRREQLCLAALSLIAGLSVVEQLPNNSLNSWTLLISGALLGKADIAISKIGRKVQRPTSISRTEFALPPKQETLQRV